MPQQTVIVLEPRGRGEHQAAGSRPAGQNRARELALLEAASLAPGDTPRNAQGQTALRASGAGVRPLLAARGE